jgi:hypothetical protein
VGGGDVAVERHADVKVDGGHDRGRKTVDEGRRTIRQTTPCDECTIRNAQCTTLETRSEKREMREV